MQVLYLAHPVALDFDGWPDPQPWQVDPYRRHLQASHRGTLDATVARSDLRTAVDKFSGSCEAFMSWDKDWNMKEVVFPTGGGLRRGSVHASGEVELEATAQ